MDGQNLGGASLRGMCRFRGWGLNPVSELANVLWLPTESLPNPLHLFGQTPARAF